MHSRSSTIFIPALMGLGSQFSSQQEEVDVTETPDVPNPELNLPTCSSRLPPDNISPQDQTNSKVNPPPTHSQGGDDRNRGEFTRRVEAEPGLVNSEMEQSTSNDLSQESTSKPPTTTQSVSKSLKCLLCEETFENQEKLLLHNSQLHESRRVHQCPFCSKSFTLARSRNRHIMRAHPDQKDG